MSQIYLPGDAVPGQVLYPKKFSAGTNYNAAGSLAPRVPNLIYNGAFSNGLAGWTAVGSAANISLDTGWNLYGGGGSIWQDYSTGAYIGNAISVVNGHKYYACGWTYFTANSTYDIFGVIVEGGGNATSLTGNVAVKNQWQFGSVIVAAGPTSANFTLRVGVWGDGRAVQAHYDGFMLIDLTDAFGVGKEPDKATMDAIVQANGGFWDSVVALSVPIRPNYGSPANYAFDSTHVYVRLNKGLYAEGSPGTSGNYPEVVITDPNFIAANILFQRTIFGLAGDGSARGYAQGTIASGGGARTVTGLAFTPRMIIVETYNSGGSSEIRYTYVADGDARFNAFPTSTNQVAFTADKTWSIFAGGFSLTLGTGSALVRYFAWG